MGDSSLKQSFSRVIQFWQWLKSRLSRGNYHGSDALSVNIRTNCTTHIRLLLFGPTGSGKSTIINQMRLLYGKEFSDEERAKFVWEIRRYLGDAILEISRVVSALKFPVTLQYHENEEKVRYLQNYEWPFNYVYSSEFYDCVEALLADHGVQTALQMSNKFKSLDNANYFLDKISTIKKVDYLPSNEDILRCCMYDDIRETRFQLERFTYDMFHVGSCGVRERGYYNRLLLKTATIFIASLSSYDLYPYDGDETELKYSLFWFGKVLKRRMRRILVGDTISILLFLNKEDQLRQKVLSGKTKLEEYFPDFEGYQLPTDMPSTMKNDLPTRAKYFIRDLFLDIFTRTFKGVGKCYVHFTCAINADSTKQTFSDCYDVIYQEHLLHPYRCYRAC